MSKLRPRPVAGLIAGVMALAPAPVQAAAMLGPHAADCAGGGARPAMVVRVLGLKNRAGALRVQFYGGDPSRYFDKGTYLERIDLALPASGPVEVCVPVRASGTYAVSVRHDANNNGRSDMDDGAGMSGNPNVSLMDVVFRRKPTPGQVAVQVRGVTAVPVVMNYVRGMSVGPVASVASAGR